jgi:NAD(P)-dependent dehydrogenase (short-subunit alcohol dehydrogenase family)
VLEGKTFLVTGACGGLGRAVVSLLAGRGASVFAADIDREALKELSEDGVHPLFLDVTDPAAVKLARVEIQQAAPSLGGLVCAAGTYVGGPLLDVSEKDIRRALEVNVMGVVLVVKELFPLLREGSRVVLVSSESTRVAMPFTGPYIMSKCALEAFAATLRREFLPLGIGVTVLQPGAIKTALLASAANSLSGDSALPLYRKALNNASRVLGKEMKTGMEPDRVARLIVHCLESPHAPRLCRVGNDPLRATLSRLPAPIVDAVVKRFL